MEDHEGVRDHHRCLPSTGELPGSGALARHDTQDGPTGGRTPAGGWALVTPTATDFEEHRSRHGAHPGTVRVTDGRISAERLLAPARTAGYQGSARNFRRAVARVKAQWRQKRRIFRPWIASPGQHLVIDWSTLAPGLHLFRAVLSTVPKAAQQMVAATLRTIFAQPDRDGARETIARISRLFERRFAKLVAVLQEAEVDILAFHSFPLEHRRQIWSTNALECLNREVGRRCEVVGIFPNRPSLLRLVGAVLEDQNDEWAVGHRYFSQESMHKLIEPTP